MSIHLRNIIHHASTRGIKWGCSCMYSTSSRFHQKVSQDVQHPRILITGSLGQLGQDLSKVLKMKYGRDNVIMSDIVRAPRAIMETGSIQSFRHFNPLYDHPKALETKLEAGKGPYKFIDVLDFRNLQEIIVNYNIDWVVHLSALLSAVGEMDVPLAIKVNIQGLHNVMELAKMYDLRIFCPSTIGAFGPESPKINTPDLCVQRPKTIYGVSKVHAELLGEYYCHRFGVDFRCLRLPGVLSATGVLGGGTTDYSVHMFDEALQKGSYECYLNPDTTLPMIYIDDCLRGIVEMLEAPQHFLTQRTYNLAALSFCPEEIAAEIRKYIPDFTVTYNPDHRQQIAESWPKSLDDSKAREDWGWRHHFNIEDLVRVMLAISSKRLGVSPAMAAIDQKN